MTEDCLFCRLAAGELGTKLIREDEHCVAFEDINPQAPTHVLVIPRRHVSTLNDLEESDHVLVGRMVAMARDVAVERGHADAGYRTVFNCNAAGGQTVFHIHLHLLGGRNLAWPPG